MSGGYALWIGVIAGMAAAGQVMGSAYKRIGKARRTQEGRLRQVDELSQLVREKARTTLALKREERQMTRELAELQGSIDNTEREVTARKANEQFLYLFDERKAPDDGAYVVTITHPNFNRIAKHAPDDVVSSWRSGRRYMVWAASPKAALAKSTHRHPPERGYLVKGGERFDRNPEEM
ncbi:MAG TPA: hypothetical protein VEB20_22715 [Azospirillaceae bacterium]|nr:hypothetical protein [Azospirillaceae bacterium]